MRRCVSCEQVRREQTTTHSRLGVELLLRSGFKQWCCRRRGGRRGDGSGRRRQWRIRRCRAICSSGRRRGLLSGGRSGRRCEACVFWAEHARLAPLGQHEAPARHAIAKHPAGRRDGGGARGEVGGAVLSEEWIVCRDARGADKVQALCDGLLCVGCQIPQCEMCLCRTWLGISRHV